MARILIIEDDTSNAFLLQRLVEMMGHEAHHIANGEHILDVIAQYYPDLILLDLRLPSIDGWHIAQLVRQQQQTIPIIAVSVEITANDRDDALAAGCDAYMPKPIDTHTLQQLIQEQLATNAQQHGWV